MEQITVRVKRVPIYGGYSTKERVTTMVLTRLGTTRYSDKVCLYRDRNGRLFRGSLVLTPGSFLSGEKSRYEVE